MVFKKICGSKKIKYNNIGVFAGKGDNLNKKIIVIVHMSLIKI